MKPSDADAEIPGAKKSLKFSPGTLHDELLLLLAHLRVAFPDVIPTY